MISYIRGMLTGVGDGTVVVETGGIGYLLHVPSGPASPYYATGEEVTVWTHLSVTQDAMTLYGFYTQEERDLFRMLITVSGIGPKGALGILSVLAPDALRYAIVSEDDAAISAAPGIGKKTARKLILELKDKIDALAVYGEEIGAEIASDHTAGSDTDAVKEAIEALTALGYRPSEARAAVKGCGAPEGAGVEELLKMALKML